MDSFRCNVFFKVRDRLHPGLIRAVRVPTLQHDGYDTDDYSDRDYTRYCRTST